MSEPDYAHRVTLLRQQADFGDEYGWGEVKVGSPFLRAAADAIEALVKERDALRSERDLADELEGETWIASKRLQAERDALAAKVARVLSVCATFDESDRLDPDGSAHTFRRSIQSALYDQAVRGIRAALADEPIATDRDGLEEIAKP